MWFGQAAGKLARNSIEAYNRVTGKWELQPFKVQLANSGRWIGRSESFYNRRIILCPRRLDPKYQVVRLVSGSEYLIYGTQENVQANSSYLFDVSVLNVEPVGYAQVVSLNPGVSSSGVKGIKGPETVIGNFPVAFDRYASSTSNVAKDVVQSRINCFIPTYANLKRDHIIRLAGEEYDVKEVVREIDLTHATLVQR